MSDKQLGIFLNLQEVRVFVKVQGMKIDVPKTTVRDLLRTRSELQRKDVAFPKAHFEEGTLNLVLEA